MKVVLPVGPALVTIVYGAFAYLVEHYAPECLSETCASEGVDDSIANWGSDVFVAVVMLAFAHHLQRSDRRIRRSGIRCQVFTAIAFVLWSLAHAVFPNSGAKDGKGSVGYYAVVGLAFFCATQSLLEHDSFVRAVFRHAPKDPKVCGHRFLKVFQSLSIFALFGVLAGCVWCAVDSGHVGIGVSDGATDIEGAGFEGPMCYRTLLLSEHAWHVVYSLFWTSSSMLLLAATNDNDASFLFLPVSIAAPSIAAIHWTVGFMSPVYIRGAALLLDEDMTELYRDCYGPYIFHYGVLLSFYMSHTVAYKTPLRAISDAVQSEGQADDDRSGDGIGAGANDELPDESHDVDSDDGSRTVVRRNIGRPIVNCDPVETRLKTFMAASETQAADYDDDDNDVSEELSV